MSKRVSPTAHLRVDIDESFSSDRELSSILEDVARLSVRLMMQVAVEAEVDEFLGRVRYERRDDDDRPGSRNGWQPPTTVKTTMGPVELQRPKLRGGVLLPAVRRRRHPHQRAGVVGQRREPQRARPSGPGSGGWGPRTLRRGPAAGFQLLVVRA